MLFVCHPKILHKHCLQFLLGVKIAPRETENNAYAKFWGDKQRALWYVMIFSGVVNCKHVLVFELILNRITFESVTDFLKYDYSVNKKSSVYILLLLFITS